MSSEYEILDGENRRTGSKIFQLTLFIFAVLGFLLKLGYAFNSYIEYGSLLKIRALAESSETLKAIRMIRLVFGGTMIHSVLLLAGSLLLFFRKKAAIAVYVCSQLLLVFCLLAPLMVNLSVSFDNIWLTASALSIAAAIAFTLLNFKNRHYWQS